MTETIPPSFFFCFFFLIILESTLQRDRRVTKYTPSYAIKITQPFSGCL